MEADAFLTLFIAKVDNVGANDADNAELRAKRLSNLVQVSLHTWDAHDWSWALRSGTATVTSGNSSVVVPSGYGNPSAKGAMFDSTGEPLSYIAPEKMKRRQLDVGDRPSIPDEYSFFDIDSSTKRELIQTPVLSASATLTLLWKDDLPTLADTTDGAFLKIPEKIQRGPIWAGMKAIVNVEKGDPRYSEFQEDPVYKAELRSKIAANQKGKEQTFQLPSFFGD